MPPSRRSVLTTALSGLGASLASAPAVLKGQSRRRPNILLAIADDQSWIHTGAAGDKVVRTPAFDRVASAGVLFRNAFCPAPQCAPGRAALLTGRNIWQLEEAGTHASLFPRKFSVYPGALRDSGYFIGLTGKGAGPCDFRSPGWPHNPAGPPFDSRRLAQPRPGINANDYSANFADFLLKRPKEQPFCFWLGCQEPHRVYEKGTGSKSGKKLTDVIVPPFLPDNQEVRGDLLDYLTEIEHFDRHLAMALDHIEKAGELENTIVVATADNGMSFPGAKATMYEHGWHVPLAISWPAAIPGGRTVEDLASFIDFAPTFLEAAGVKPPAPMTGRSMLRTLTSRRSGLVDASRNQVFAGRERHSHARFDNLGYPARAVRTLQYLYVHNLKPDRWPAGDPPGYHDIDDGPSKSWMIEHRSDPGVERLFEHCFGKHPEEELFDIVKDPGCLNNLAGSAAHAKIRAQLRATLDRTLTAQADPRMKSSEIFDSYPRISPMRPDLGGFATQSAYNPKYK
jgi:N-sulfoglucosamine sulfohydrolase